jgi:hypothetical protein
MLHRFIYGLEDEDVRLRQVRQATGNHKHKDKHNKDKHKDKHKARQTQT